METGEVERWVEGRRKRSTKVENGSCFTVGVVRVTNLRRMAESTVYMKH